MLWVQSTMYQANNMLVIRIRVFYAASGAVVVTFVQMGVLEVVLEWVKQIGKRWRQSLMGH